MSRTVPALPFFLSVLLPTLGWEIHEERTVLCPAFSPMLGQFSTHQGCLVVMLAR